MKENELLELLKYALGGNQLPQYRSLLHDVKNWTFMCEDFKGVFHASNIREEVLEILAKLNFEDLKSNGETDDQVLSALVRILKDLVPVATVRDNNEMSK